MSEFDDPLLVFAGVVTDDAIAVVERYPGPDERVPASTIVSGGGGPAATAAVAAARLGARSALIAAVGDDDTGARVVDGLETEGVDTSGVRVVPGARTARSLVVISGEDRHRAISNQVGPALSLDGHDRAHELIASASWVHVDQHGWAPVRAFLDVMTHPPRLSVDAGNPIEGYRPEGTALYVPTRDALARRYGRADGVDDIESLLRRAVDDGADTAVATDGPNGATALSSGGELVSAPAPSTRIVSTLGAGDVFHGALLAALVRPAAGRPSDGLVEALRFATAAAALSCRGIDGRSGIPRDDEVAPVLASMNRPEAKGMVV